MFQGATSACTLLMTLIRTLLNCSRNHRSARPDLSVFPIYIKSIRSPAALRCIRAHGFLWQSAFGGNRHVMSCRSISISYCIFLESTSAISIIVSRWSAGAFVQNTHCVVDHLGFFTLLPPLSMLITSLLLRFLLAAVEKRAGQQRDTAKWRGTPSRPPREQGGKISQLKALIPCQYRCYCFPEIVQQQEALAWERVGAVHITENTDKSRGSHQTQHYPPSCRDHRRLQTRKNPDCKNIRGDDSSQGRLQPPYAIE